MRVGQVSKKEFIMRSFNIRRLVSIAGLAAAISAGAIGASAQNHGQWNKQEDKNYKQQQRQEQQNRKLEQERQKREQQQARLVRNHGYRVNQGGQWYNVDQRQSNLLKQAINAGYKQGFKAGRTDRNSRRQMSWDNSSVYRSGSYGYQSSVNRGQYQYYFQQGFERGYQDGYNSRNQFGSGSGGNMIGSILQGILGLQSY